MPLPPTISAIRLPVRWSIRKARVSTCWLWIRPAAAPILAIDGRDGRQVRYAQRIMRERPQTVLFYTRLGGLADASLTASPLTPPLAQRLGIRSVPTYMQQQGDAWRMVSVPPFD